ncbi:MAG TPA: ATP-binding cassette domain-containing protein [Dehalococcoidia bacterium]|jgi:cobalt/nickel transport system ATP-binding protein|nr:ATP-binding cassette domain-containing protein [Dehalococcoidia bacterium]
MDDAIRIEKLSFSYPDGHQALAGVSLVIGRGESVGIAGPNGAGKSTLLLHLNGILRSDDGAVKVLGQPVDDKNLRWIRSKVGLVFQDPDDQLFSPTVFDDVAFGPINMGYTASEVKEAVARALDWVGMKGCEERSCHHLSFGEKKRVSLATVLAMDPEILVLDEPTSNLDPAGKWALISLLKKLAVTKIVATHDLEMMQALCQRIVLLDQGQVVAEGPAEKILADKDLLAAHGLLSAEPV